MKHNEQTFSLVNENFILYYMLGKHAMVMGLFRTSSDCSYFLAFQNEQFHLDSKKEETLNSSSDDSLKYNNKERKDIILSVSKAGCHMTFIKSQP